MTNPTKSHLPLAAKRRMNASQISTEEIRRTSFRSLPFANFHRRQGWFVPKGPCMYLSYKSTLLPRLYQQIACGLREDEADDYAAAKSYFPPKGANSCAGHFPPVMSRERSILSPNFAGAK
jgi:hypothetical protein